MLRQILLIVIISLFMSSLNAQESKALKVTVGSPITISEDEIYECSLGMVEKKSICETIIRMNKEKYLTYLEKGYPDIKPLSKKDLEVCEGMEERFRFKCKSTLIKSRMDVTKIEYIKYKSRNKRYLDDEY